MAWAYVSMGGPDGHLYEVLSVILISAGVNLLTSTTAWFTQSSPALEGLMLTACGGILYFLAQRVKEYHSRAESKQVLERRGLKREHLKEILSYDLERRTKVVWLEVVFLIMVLSTAAGAITWMVHLKPARDSAECLGAGPRESRGGAPAVQRK